MSEYEAGRETDVEVAEQLFGLRAPLGWSPSTDIVAAWEVVEKMRERGWGLTLMTPGAYTDEGLGPMDKFSAVFAKPTAHPSHDWAYAEADSAPLAICAAALRTATQAMQEQP